MYIEWLKFLGIVFIFFGNLMLSIRVTRILSSLSFVAECHEINIDQLVRGQRYLIHLTNSTKHIQKAKGNILLILGFILILIGLILQGYPYWKNILCLR